MMWNPIKKFRNKTPEQLAEQSRKEKEWAENCYKAGEKFAKKIDLQTKVTKINTFGNKYPKTFFTIIFTMLIGCFVFNYLFATCTSFITDKINTIEDVSIPAENNKGKKAIEKEINELYKDLESLTNKIDAKFQQDSLSHQDSIEINAMMVQMQELNTIINSKEKSNE